MYHPWQTQIIFGAHIAIAYSNISQAWHIEHTQKYVFHICKRLRADMRTNKSKFNSVWCMLCLKLKIALRSTCRAGSCIIIGTRSISPCGPTANHGQWQSSDKIITPNNERYNLIDTFVETLTKTAHHPPNVYINLPQASPKLFDSFDSADSESLVMLLGQVLLLNQLMNLQLSTARERAVNLVNCQIIWQKLMVLASTSHGHSLGVVSLDCITGITDHSSWGFVWIDYRS